MRFFLLLAAGLLLAACQDANDPDNRPSATTTTLDGPSVAQVNGSDVPEEMLLAFIRMRNQTGETEEQREQALKQLVDLYLLTQDAESNGLLARRTVAAELAVQRLSLTANRALAEYSRANPISDEAVRAEYDAGMALTGTLEYQVRHILFPDEQRARGLIAQLDSGASFITLEQSLVEELGSSNAGPLGWVNNSQVPEEFGVAMAKLSPGSYSAEPVASPYGWHVIQLEQVRELAPPAFEEVAASIRTALTRRQVEQYLEGLRVAAGLDTAPANR
jgi:peptidyl-prolyl cis-trans isomerase C